MGATTLVILGALIFYLFVVSKQRRKRGEPPLPIVGELFQPLLDYEEGLQTTTKSNSTNTDEIPTPVATIPNDIAEVATTEPKKEPEPAPPPPPPPAPESLKEMPPPPPPAPTPAPEPLKEEPLPDIVTAEETVEDDSEEKKKKKKKKKKKDKKSKGKKKKKSSKSNSKDSRDEHKRWSKHKHTNKKIAAASIVSNPNTPPL
uniref:Lysine-rich arabinogalactan protein 19-like n=1 Tax=Panagrellus redivivus TaxID=6233 RepID=A0A7E4VZL8_PANRE